MRILGIETSCDETGIAVYDSDTHEIIAESVYTQTTPAEFGGVVPELASRDHIQKAMPMILSLFESHDLDKNSLDAVAYTAGPGLVGALLVGASLAESIAYGLGLPAIGVHHLEGHLLSPMLGDDAPQFPYLALLVSGGHTLLLSVERFGQYKVLGDTLDDAVGEAFDKTARLLGLSYPGGPELEALAQGGDSSAYRFPRPMTDRPGLDFSFSGLKTFAMNTFRDAESKQLDQKQSKANIARCFQDAVVDTLVIKCKRAVEQTGFSRLVVAGGVGANQSIQEAIKEMMTTKEGQAYFPLPKYCTDNGAMIAYVGYLRLETNMRINGVASARTNYDYNVRPRWPLEELTRISHQIL